MYLNDNYKQLFVELKRNLLYFECIEIEWEKVIAPEGIDATLPDNGGTDEIFQGIKDKEYSIDDNVVKISEIQQGIESFAIIHKNIIDWFQRIQKATKFDIKNEDVQERRVRFLV